MLNVALPIDPNSALARAHGYNDSLKVYKLALPQHTLARSPYVLFQDLIYVPAGYRLLSVGAAVTDDCYWLNHAIQPPGAHWFSTKFSHPTGKLIGAEEIVIAPMTWPELAALPAFINGGLRTKLKIPPSTEAELNNFGSALSASLVNWTSYGYAYSSSRRKDDCFIPQGFRLKNIGEPVEKFDFWFDEFQNKWRAVVLSTVGDIINEDCVFFIAPCAATSDADADTVAPAASLDDSDERWSCTHKRLSESPLACKLCKIMYNRDVTT